MGRTILACRLAASSFAWALAGSPVLAQEPLLLRIRPPDAAPAEIGAGGGMPSAEEVARARAAREAVWERADRRARIAIASVCSGCLQPERPAARLTSQPRPEDAIVRAQTTPPEPPATGDTAPADILAQSSTSQTGTP
ncbi:hypothetical protein [Methylobacterium sp. Leaf106]|uniref:hypothetical protein n=1 Tax=Methylobacterium sp. Leaf106 TaxID=1736255 RepID=UPI0006FFCE0C|nr:hypothetical protein [Methylobacterium sp. Leaf106]KQP51621.1 hypothetical protein ASF34_19275 [Methylobacterium sp. Leaf106]